uniref:Uncharacterized protein n=1 Tax=Rhizophora mucronata TaxID=61149 RepID=A0A2P2LU37_RHIMU
MSKGRAKNHSLPRSSCSLS